MPNDGALPSKADLLNAASRVSLDVFFRRVFPVIESGKELVHAPYLELTADRLERLLEGLIMALVFCMPPRMLKSALGTVAFIAWYLGHRPGARVILASHTLLLAKTHLAKIRRLIESDVYRAIFPGLELSSATDVQLETTDGGVILAVGFEAAPTGLGADLLVIDDPIKANDTNSGDMLERNWRYFEQSLRPRLNHPSASRVLVIMQRFHRRDFVGRMLEACQDDFESGRYELLALSLIATETEDIPYGKGKSFRRQPGDPLPGAYMSLADVERLRASQTEADYAAAYQQAPLAEDGGYIRPAWLSEADPPALTEPGPVIQAWDTAVTTGPGRSYSVGTTWKIIKGVIYLIDIYRDQVEHEELYRQALALADRFSPAVVVIEQANSGYGLQQAFSSRKDVPVEMVIPTRSKDDRLRQCLVAFSSLKVQLPKNHPGLKAFREEILNFPNSRYTDQVDSMTLALNFILPRISGDKKDSRFSMYPKVIAMGPRPDSNVYRVGGSITLGKHWTPTLRPKGRR